MKLFGEEFDKYVLEPCKIVDGIFSSSLNEFFQQAQNTPDLGERIRASKSEDYEWLLNVGVCRSILDHVDMMRNMSFGHSLHSRVKGCLFGEDCSGLQA